MSSGLAAQRIVSRTSYDCAAVRAMVHACTASRQSDYLAARFDYWRHGSLRARWSALLLRLGMRRLLQRLVTRVSPGDDVFLHARQVVADQLIRDALDREPETQIVILGAGLDTSALRIGAERRADGRAPGRFFEVDLPATQADKRRQIEALRQKQPIYDRHLAWVPCDFGQQTLTKVLRDAGFERELPTLWVWAGALMYLPETQARATVGELRALSAPGSRLYFDMILEEALARPNAYGFERVLKRLASFGEVMGAGFRSGRDHVGSWLFPQGFQLEQVFDDVDMAMVWSESTGMPAPSTGAPWSQLCVARTR